VTGFGLQASGGRIRYFPGSSGSETYLLVLMRQNNCRRDFGEMNMKKLFILPCVLSVVLLLCCLATSSPVVLAEGNEENVTAVQDEQAEATEQTDVTEQSEATKPTEVTEQTEATEQTDPGKETSETVDTSAPLSNDAKPGGDLQTQTPTDETADAAKKPLVIDGLVLTDAERRVFELTNAERQKRGLPALRLDRRLMESARRQANWMARTGIFRHGNSGFAENIAMGQRSSRDVVIAWMKSTGHFRNMMNRSHGAIGIGSYRGKNGAMFWCQQFSR
jgi:uncharacterized protein YkwD